MNNQKLTYETPFGIVTIHLTANDEVPNIEIDINDHEIARVEFDTTNQTIHSLLWHHEEDEPTYEQQQHIPPKKRNSREAEINQDIDMAILEIQQQVGDQQVVELTYEQRQELIQKAKGFQNSRYTEFLQDMVDLMIKIK